MNKKLSVTCTLILFYALANAQTYFPFPNSNTNARWNVESGYYDLTFGTQIIDGTTFYGIMGDTLIDGILYEKVYWCGFPWTNDTAFNPATATYYSGMRESNKQIYMRFWADTVEKLHYDFNLALGDSFYFYYAPMMGWHWVTSVDSELVSSSYRRSMSFVGSDTWIEGIGSDAGLFESNLLIGNIYTLLLCYSENETTIYSPYGTCNRFNTGITESNENTSVRVFPNPFSNELHVISKSNMPVEIILTDIVGQNILRQAFTLSTTINTERLANGVYLYQVNGNNGTIKTGTVVKQ